MIVSGMMTTADNASYSKQDFTLDQKAVVATTTQSASGIATSVEATSSVSKDADAVGTDSAGKNVSTSKKGSSNPNAKVESAVREYFSDIPLMAEIAKCESHFRQFEKDGSIFRGKVNDRDVGALQINEYYHAKRAQKLGIDIYTVKGNMEYARVLYEESGSQPWISSSPCWMKSDVAKAMFAPKVLAEK